MLEKHYKDQRIVLGLTDVSIITFIGLSMDLTEQKTWTWYTGEDGAFFGYLVNDPDVTIPDYYEKVFECRGLRILDDYHATFNSWRVNDELMQKYFPKGKIKYEIYRAGERGCIVRGIPYIEKESEA